MAFEIDENVLRFLNGHLGNNDEDAYKRCSDFAYRDMCRTIKFADDYKESKEKSRDKNNMIAEKKRCKRAKVTKLIKEQIEKWLENTDNFDVDHAGLCHKIIEEYKGTTNQGNEDNSLYFGQAQKWVNMTLKNLYVYSESNNTSLSLKPLLPHMHIPLDSIIMDIATGKKKCYTDNNKEISYGVKKPKDSKNNEICWSKFDESVYTDYQGKLINKIKETHPDMHPIIWELTHWSTVKEKPDET